MEKWRKKKVETKCSYESSCILTIFVQYEKDENEKFKT